MEYRSPDPVIASLSEALPLAGAPLTAGFAPQYPSIAFGAPSLMSAQAHISYPTTGDTPFLRSMYGSVGKENNFLNLSSLLQRVI